MRQEAFMTTRPFRPAERMEKLPPYLFGVFNRLCDEKRQNGEDVIDLGMGNPTDPAPAAAVERLCTAATDPAAHRYPAAAGAAGLRAAIAASYQKEQGVDLDPETEVIGTIGSKEGISHLCLGLVGPGDTVLVPAPAFPIHVWAPVIAGANVIRIPMGDGRDLARQVRRMCETLVPRPKLVILNFPHNPTAQLAPEGLFDEMVALARRYDFRILHDYAYARLTYDGYQAPSFLETPGAKEVAVEFGSFSKTYNMAGWRLGWCAGNQEMVATLGKIKGYFDYGIFTPVQLAGITALTACEEDAACQRNLYEKRRNRFCKALQEAGWPVTPPAAGMFIWAKLPESVAGLSAMEFSLRLLETANVAVTPGIGFGEEGEGYVRMAIVESETRLLTAAERIKNALGPLAENALSQKFKTAV